MKKKRILKFTGAASLALMLLTACGDSNLVIKDSLSDVSKAIMNCGTEFPDMVEVNEENFSYEYGLENGDYEEFSVYWAGSGGQADEICVIKTTEEKIDKVEDAVEERLDARKESFDGYVEEEYEKLCKSEVKKKGSYVYWLCTNDNEKTEKELLSHFVEDAGK